MKEKRKTNNSRMKSYRTVNFKRKRRKRNKKLVNRIFIVVIFLTVLFGLGYGLFVLGDSIFKLNEIIIEGNTMYSDTEILDTAGFTNGEGLLFLNTEAAEKKIYKSFPYVDEISIHKQLPNKLKIDISTATRQFSIFKDDAFYVVSERGKMLEVVPELPSEAIELRGMDFEIDENGKIVYVDKDLEKLLLEIEEEVSNVGLGGIRVIDLTNSENIVLNYEDRISIIIGSKEDLHYKVVTAKEIISNKINKFEKGELDLRNLTRDNKSYFTPISE